MRFVSWVAIVAMLMLDVAQVRADCCRSPIVVSPPNTKPGADPDPVGDIVPDPIDDGPNLDGELDLEDDGNVPAASEMSEAEMLGKIGSLGGAFREDLQQAVIGWNGSEEVLILTTNEESTVGNSAMLTFLPLPGEPIEIARADKKAFGRAKKLVLSKAALPVRSNSLGVFMERTIGSHHIFVWKIEESEDFATRVQAYISEKYGGRAKACLTEQMLKVVDQYHKRGFRYFAFDLTGVNSEKSTKEAIAYHFKSEFCFYPMVISSGSGTGATVAELVVFTKKELTKLGGIPRDKIIKVGDKTVAVSSAELAAVDPRLGKIFGDEPTLTGRILDIPGKLQDFDKDFIAQ